MIKLFGKVSAQKPFGVFVIPQFVKIQGVVFMAKGKVEFREAYCKGCSLCVNACPKKILQISKRTNAKGYEVAECVNMDECIGCASCATMCPDSVITVYRD